MNNRIANDSKVLQKIPGLSRKEATYCKYIAKQFIYMLKINRTHRFEKLHTFYSRIRCFDVKSVKIMSKKYKFLLEKNCLHKIFERRKNVNWNNFITDTADIEFWNDIIYNYSKKAVSTNIDYFSESYKRRGHIHTQHDRIVKLEKNTLQLLRFFLKKGMDPNEPIFLQNLILKHKWHCKQYFMRLFEICINYGLDKSKLEQVLKNTEINRKNSYFFLYPILDTHTQSLELHDNVNICYEWIHYKNFYEILQSSSKGTLQNLNEDVITIICQFLYNPYYNCYV